LVELMGGEIWLESEPGKGSTFLFTVSVGVASGPAQEQDHSRTASRHVGPGGG
jgi:signal transduction histidine kinase